MPVSQLLVEGNLDAEVLDPIIGAGITVTNAHGKGALSPRTRDDWKKGLRGTRYIRDRDFDFEPPSDLSAPTPDKLEDNEPLGWRWCRHSIENYLIDPALVETAIGWPKVEYEPELLRVALSIRHYQIARWVVGTVRRGLPPHYLLSTSPDDCPSGEIGIPADLSEQSSLAWERGHLQGYFSHLSTSFAPTEITCLEAKFTAQLSIEVMSRVEGLLVWCSGKDLLAGMATTLQARGYNSPKTFINALRDWVREKPEQATNALPEWKNFLGLLKEIP